MAHIQARNVFRIDADEIRIEGRHARDAEIDFSSDGKKLRFNQVLDIDGSKGAFIQGKKGQQLIKDEDGTAIMEVKADGNLKLLTSVDFNNQAPVNFSGGGGGGATTTSGITSENLVGQTLEDELDQITTQQTTNTGAIATNTTDIATNTLAIGTNTTNITNLTTQQNTNTGAIATNTTNIATNTTGITNLNTQQATNTNNIASLQLTQASLQTLTGTNATNITALQTQQATNTADITLNATGIGTALTNATNALNASTTNATNITALTTQQNTNTGAIATNTTNIATANTNATNALNASNTNATNITALTTQQTTNTGAIATNTTNIGNLTTQQNLNTSAIASNTARTSNLTADRVLISSATGTINTAGVGITDLATISSSNIFSGGLGNPATTNAFDTITASTISNFGATESASYTQGGAPLNFSHLAGNSSTAQLPSEVVRTDLADQTITNNGALSKLNLDNNNATGASEFRVVKKNTSNVVENALKIQANASGLNITGEAPVGQTPDISITPANGSLAMTIGAQDTRCHNNFKILGSLQGAARNDNKDYVFKTIGATGTGDVLLTEDILQRPKAGNPALGFNPAGDAVVQFSSAGVPSYKLLNTFFPLPAGLPTNPSAVLIDSAGATTYLDSNFVLTKPGGANPAATSFVAVNTGGTYSYVPNTFAPMPGGAFPTSGENVIMMNPAGSSYVDRANLIERPGNANPTSGTKLITINNVGTRAYKDLGQFITTPSNANPSADSVVQITSTGVQSYVAVADLQGVGKPGGANPSATSLVSIASNGTEAYVAESTLLKTNAQAQQISQGLGSTAVEINSNNGGVGIESHFKVSTTGTPGGTDDNSLEIIAKRGAPTEMKSETELDIYTGGTKRIDVGATTTIAGDLNCGGDLQMVGDFKLKHASSLIPTNNTDPGDVGTIVFDDNYLYVKRSAGQWKRIGLSNF